MDTVKSIQDTYSTDFWNRSPVRLAAWAHSCGEAAACLFPKVAIPLSAVTGIYVLLSAIDRGRRAREVERFPDIADLVGRKVISESLVTQWAGLIYLPSAIVGGASSLISGALKSNPSLGLKLSPQAVRFLPVVVPLLLVPLALPASEALSDAASKWALRPLLDSIWPTAGARLSLTYAGVRLCDVS
jgi:hypothetical protein